VCSWCILLAGGTQEDGIRASLDGLLLLK
jgi:hypothetical protein